MSRAVSQTAAFGGWQLHTMLKRLMRSSPQSMCETHEEERNLISLGDVLIRTTQRESKILSAVFTGRQEATWSSSLVSALNFIAQTGQWWGADVCLYSVIRDWCTPCYNACICVMCVCVEISIRHLALALRWQHSLRVVPLKSYWNTNANGCFTVYYWFFHPLLRFDKSDATNWI